MSQRSAIALKKRILRRHRPVAKPLRLVEDRPAELKSFYKIANHDGLAALGASFLEDYRKGIRSFAVASTGYKASQQRTVLALATYFDHVADARILIVSDILHRGAFRELIQAAKEHHLSVGAGDQVIDVHRFHHHFDFIDLKRAFRFNFIETMDTLFMEYDIILWDTPILSTDKNTTETFNRIAGYFDSLSLIVSPNDYKKSDPSEIRKHFDGYGINVRGVNFKGIGGVA